MYQIEYIIGKLNFKKELRCLFIGLIYFVYNLYFFYMLYRIKIILEFII